MQYFRELALYKSFAELRPSRLDDWSIRPFMNVLLLTRSPALRTYVRVMPQGDYRNIKADDSFICSLYQETQKFRFLEFGALQLFPWLQLISSDGTSENKKDDSVLVFVLMYLL